MMLLIFDCDGVLVDTETVVTEAHVEHLARAGYDISPAELLTRFLGMSDQSMYAEIEKDLGRPLPADYDAEVHLDIKRRFARSLPPMPGLVRVLEALSCATCVASSSSRDMLTFKLSTSGLDRYFPAMVFSADDVERAKPHPDLFILAAQRMGHQPADCVVIEDSVNGVRAARAAGMRVLGFTGAGHLPAGHDAKLRLGGAEAVLDHFDQLPEQVPQAFASR